MSYFSSKRVPENIDEFNALVTSVNETVDYSNNQNLGINTFLSIYNQITNALTSINNTIASSMTLATNVAMSYNNDHIVNIIHFKKTSFLPLAMDSNGAYTISMMAGDQHPRLLSVTKFLTYIDINYQIEQDVTSKFEVSTIIGDNPFGNAVQVEYSHKNILFSENTDYQYQVRLIFKTNSNMGLLPTIPVYLRFTRLNGSGILTVFTMDMVFFEIR